METPKLNSFKVRERLLLRKRKGLTREMETLWNRKVPQSLGTSTAWSVLGSLVDDLSEGLSDTLETGLRSVVKDRDVLGYLNLGAWHGSPQMYDSPGGYFAACQALNLLKKFPWTDARVDPLAKGVARFRTAERLCAKTNKRLKHYRKFDFSYRPLPKRLDVHQVYHLARRKIASWIGRLEERELLGDVRFGPGGVVGLKRPFTTPYYKFSESSYTVSTGAYLYGLRAIAGCDAWIRGLAQDAGLEGWDTPIRCVPYETKVRLADARTTIADYNEVTFVPKNATTHRAIAIEPHLNVALQLAVGRHLRDRLKRYGCDLHDQTRNQELARIGSIYQDDHDPVTLDLAMASDTLSIELVRELVPCEWFEYLSCLRSRSGTYLGEEFKWEKFSSMGNGFTFELESMIFYALAQSVSDLSDETDWFHDTFGPAFKYAYVSVYGDDIIVPKRIAEHLIGILRFSGFELNAEKSFITGPFRESCGKDYFSGVLVRPFYLTRGLSHVKDLIHLLNNLRGIQADWDVNLGKTISFVESLMPRSLELHLRGPRRTTGDDYIWREPDDCHASFFVVWDADMQTWVYPIMKPVLSLNRGKLIWRYCQFLYGETNSSSAITPAWADFIPPGPLPYKETDFFHMHVSAGGSAGDVVLSGANGEGKLHLAS